MAFDATKTPGSFGSIPADAPREVSQPLSPELIAQQQAKARANEQVLPPFNPPGNRKVGTLQKMVNAAADMFGNSPQPPVPPAVAPPAQVVGPVEQTALPGPNDPVLPPIQPHQRAGSNTDSPSRGIPTRVGDPGKQVTGGFGPAVGLIYEPLNGSELRDKVTAMLLKVIEDMKNDLRFSMALTYPRIKVSAEIRFTGFADVHHDFEVPCVGFEMHENPIEVAREVATEVCFVVRAGHAEDGTSATAPNAVRGDLGLPIPAKQPIEVPGGVTWADFRG